jgi:protein TonB
MPVVRATKAVVPAPAPVAAQPKRVEQTWQPAPRPKQQSAAPKFDHAPSNTQRAAEAKLAEALWPAGEQKKKAKTEPSEGGHRTLILAVGVIVCAALGAGGYMVFRSHSQPHPQTVADTTQVKIPDSEEPTADEKPDPRNELNGKNATAPGQTPNSAQQQAAQAPSNAQQPAQDTTPAQQPNPTPNVNMAQFTSAPSIPRNQQGGAPEPSGNLDASHMAGGNSGANPMFGSSNKQHVQFAPNKPIEVASGVLSPTLVKKTVPEYPPIARNMHVSGVVTVAITVTPQGTVSEAHAISGPILLRQAAVDAVRNWRFRPYLVNNHASAVNTDVNVDFALQ